MFNIIIACLIQQLFSFNAIIISSLRPKVQVTVSDQYMSIVVVVLTDAAVVLNIVGNFPKVSDVACRPLILML